MSKRKKRILKNSITSEVPDKTNYSKDDSIYFSFKYLHHVSFCEKGFKDATFLSDFLIRLQKLSELGWKKIATDKRHGYGFEKIPVDKIKPEIKGNPTPDTTFLLAFRACGDNRRFLGLRVSNELYILFIEGCFGDIYDHD